MRYLKYLVRANVRALCQHVKNEKDTLLLFVKTELICLSAVFLLWAIFMLLAFFPVLISGQLSLLKFHPMALMTGEFVSEEMIFLALMSAAGFVLLLPSLVVAHCRFFKFSFSRRSRKKTPGWSSVLTWLKVQALCIVVTVTLWCFLLALDAIAGLLISAIFSGWGRDGPLIQFLFGSWWTVDGFFDRFEITILRGVLGVFGVSAPYFYVESYLSRKLWCRRAATSVVEA